MRANGKAAGAAPLYFIGDETAWTEVVAMLRAERPLVRPFRSLTAFSAAAARLAPGELLIDLDSANVAIETALPRLLRRSAVNALLVQTARVDIDLAVAVMRLGALDLMLKPYGPDRLRVALGHARPSKTDAPALTPSARAQLSNREREVLAGLARGLTNKRIAAELGISHRTVEIHRARLMRKLGADSLAGLLDVAFGPRSGSRPRADGRRYRTGAAA